MMALRQYGGNPKIGVDDLNVVLKFGGGLHTKASADQIDPTEAADGFNFDIDLENRNLRNRAPFDLIGTVPNAQSVLGGGSLLKTDGTVTTLFQAGGVVYQWDGVSTFTEVGTCNSASQLRGRWRSHTWNLTDKLLLTDLTLNDVVKEWDGTTFQSTTFTDEKGDAFGTFYAKYLNISNECAMFANVKDASSTTPQLIIGSEQSVYTQITVTDKPSSSLSASDPFFLISPDLKPINGIAETFGTTMISTEKGQIFNLAGSSANDFAFNPFYPGSAASGTESLVDIGNDMIYGRQGRIESLIDTNTFGNSQASDITAGIADAIAKYSGWTIVFNSRTRRAYAFPKDISEVWVLDTAIYAKQQVSPWMRWETAHPMAFKPTFVMSMLDPVDGLEYIFMGDSSGNVYRMEGTGADGDGGTSNIEMQFLSKLFSAQLDSAFYDVEGYIKYAENDAATVTLTFQYQGKEIFDKSITVDLPNISSASYYGGSAYYGGNFYYGSFSGRLARQAFFPPGDANDFQLLIDVTGNVGITINEIGLRFRAAGQ
jgi:hypothetical protein